MVTTVGTRVFVSIMVHSATRELFLNMRRKSRPMLIRPLLISKWILVLVPTIFLISGAGVVGLILGKTRIATLVTGYQTVTDRDQISKLLLIF